MTRSYRQALNATVTGVAIVTTRVAGLPFGAVRRAVRGATMPLAYTRQGYTAPLAA